MSDWITISSGALTARINPLGAELSSLTDAQGRELMTNADPAFWTGRAPLLFPVVGRVRDDRYRLDDREYEMPQHGFARRTPFALIDHAPDRATFRLTNDAGTRAAFPFAFTLDMAFMLDGATLTMTATVGNAGDVPLPFSFGFHPAFAWPLPYGEARGDHRIVFSADEPDPLCAITADALIGERTRPSPLDGRTLQLADDLFARDALVWDRVRSRAVRYGAAAGPQLAIAFPDTPALGIWTRPGARFVCIEPWAGHADPAGFTGDFRDKPGVMHLAPGATHDVRMSVTLVP